MKRRADVSTAASSAAASGGSVESSRSAGVLGSARNSARQRAAAAACSSAAAGDSVWLSSRTRVSSPSPLFGRGPSTTAPSKRSGGGPAPTAAADITCTRGRAPCIGAGVGRALATHVPGYRRRMRPFILHLRRYSGIARRALGAGCRAGAMPPRRPMLRPVLDLEVLDMPLPGEDGMPVQDEPAHGNGDAAQRRPRVRGWLCAARALRSASERS